MTISQTTPEETLAGQLFCPRCNATVPARATFCGSCGERLKQKKQTAQINEQDIHTRYRITTLARRYPSCNLYFALDNLHAQGPGQARMVAMRDIDISVLDQETREKAIALVQQEYDQLRRWHIPHTLVCIDLRLYQDHLFLISALPTTTPGLVNTQRLYTLQDFLQSGLGLPRESRVLEWMHNLCQAVQQLHSQGILLGDLDPYTVVLDKNSSQAEPKLMPFWLTPDLQKLLPIPEGSVNAHVSYFKVFEALVDEVEVASDVYSLGALLYLLLTGTPPDESTLRHRRRLRSPREVNARVSQHVDECVMQALAINTDERFPSVLALMAALEDVHFTAAPSKTSVSTKPDQSVSELETVRIVPLSQREVTRWRTLRQEQAEQRRSGALPVPPRNNSKPLPPAAPPFQPGPGPSRQAQQNPQVQLGPAPLPATPPPGQSYPPINPARGNRNTPPPPSTGKALAIPRGTNTMPAVQPEQPAGKKRKQRAEKKRSARREKRVAWQEQNEGETSFLRQLQKLLLGQQRPVEAAAIIETPMRIRPDQPYNLRLHIMGRDEPTPHPDAKKGVPPAGLSALVHGEVVQIEVRSVLQQGYTYILQHATVTVPADGYTAEVTIPMQQQQISTAGRRDRLHIFFLDEHRRPIYEKPFVVEVFVSPLVQFGREGHQVLTIPI